MKNQAGIGVTSIRESSGHRIELNLRDLEQFFNTMDPSPFHEKDLDDNVEEFIVSWAKEYPLEEPVRLVVHLQNAPEVGTDSKEVIERAVHNFFRYKADLSRRELRQLFRAGRISLLIGLTFLAVCLSAAEALEERRIAGTIILAESLKIAGWVAMWHPMEVYLYGWWPLRRIGRIYRKLSTIPVETNRPKVG